MKQIEKSSQWYVLSGTRFVLALCVVITHSGIVAPGYFLWRHLGDTGYPAVFGFFMISGYSIAASLGSRPEGYFWRRVRRIYPTYIAALCFSVLILLPHPLHLPLGQVLALSNWKAIVSSVFMMQGTLTQSWVSNGPIWSLAIEWWCYMGAILLIRWSNNITKLLIALSFVSLMFYMRGHGYLLGDSNMPLGLAIPVLAWAWLTGFSYYREPTKINFAIMLMLPLIMFEMGSRVPLASVVVTLSALIVLQAKSIYIESKRAKKIIQWLGDMSYPLYVLHAPLLWWLSSETPLRNGNVLIVVVVVVVSIAYYVACMAMNMIASAFSTAFNRAEQTASN